MKQRIDIDKIKKLIVDLDDDYLMKVIDFIINEREVLLTLKEFAETQLQKRKVASNTKNRKKQDES